MQPNPTITPHTIDNDTANPMPSPTETPTRRTPTEFQIEADAFNAKAAEIAKQITDEHARHATLLAECTQRQTDHAATRKEMIGKSGEFGITPGYARAMLRK